MLLVLLLGFILLPPPIDPLAYDPPIDNGFTGPFDVNERLKDVIIYTLAEGIGPEDVEPLNDGRAVVGLDNGDISIIDQNGNLSALVNTGGRPLGLDRDPAGNIIVADALKGLLKISLSGELTPLVQSVDGILLGFTDDVDVAPDGRIYFTDASSHFAIDDLTYDFLTARPYGRVLVFNPVTGQADVVQDGLYFANGIAVSADGESLLVAETARYRVRRIWLLGEKAGTDEIIIDNLPGFPDGVSRAPDGTYWVALYAKRSWLLDAIHPYPWIKAILAKLPDAWIPKPQRYGAALRISAAGEVLETRQNPTGMPAGMVTSIEETATDIWYGSLYDGHVLRQPLAIPR